MSFLLNDDFGFSPLFFGQPESRNVFSAHFGMVWKLLSDGLAEKVSEG